MALSLKYLLDNPERINELRLSQEDPHALYRRNPSTGETEPTDRYYELLGDEIERNPICNPRIPRG